MDDDDFAAAIIALFFGLGITVACAFFAIADRVGHGRSIGHAEGFTEGRRNGYSQACVERGWEAREIDGKLACAPREAFDSLFPREVSE